MVWRRISFPLGWCIRAGSNWKPFAFWLVNLPPPNLPPPRKKALWSGLINHWFPFIKPAVKPLFLRGVRYGLMTAGHRSVESLHQKKDAAAVVGCWLVLVDWWGCWFTVVGWLVTWKDCKLFFAEGIWWSLNGSESKIWSAWLPFCWKMAVGDRTMFKYMYLVSTSSFSYVHRVRKWIKTKWTQY